MKKNIYLLFIINVLYISNSLIAQNLQALSLGKQYLEASKTNWNLTSSDLKDLMVTDQYQSDHNGVTHIYFQQAYKGIPIYNAVTSVHVTKDGKVFDSPCRFIDNIESKVNATQPRLNALQALEKLIYHYDVKNAVLPLEKRRSNDKERYFEKTNFTHSDIPARLMYFQTKDGKLRLTWDVSTDFVDRTDYWSTRVDAITGEILDQHNYTVKCSFGHQHQEKCFEQHASADLQKKNQSAFNGNQGQTNVSLTPKPAATVYNVFPFPIESPLHGSRQLVSDPAYTNASPFGWHDTNGQAGPEFTYTRGNNVSAYLDRNGDNVNDGERADGGTSLNFDFPFDSKKEPASYTKAAVTNLFYVNNMMHDVLYQFGFDEKAGNFQQNNYNKGGTGADQVLAEAQDGSGTNNANFATPADGSSGIMQMFLWTAAPGEVRVDAPAEVEGYLSVNGATGWGGRASTTPITGEVVWSNDGDPGNEKKGCKDAQKRSILDGKIVLIERGLCDFSEKAYYAQKAGAKAVIICGFDEQNVGMAAGANATLVTIPAYFARKSVCDKIAPFVGKGLIITVKTPEDTNAGPDSLDGDFDNGIITHEYGHGVSNRLTGGPAQANCLSNEEHMGEGWSDFMSLIMTAKQGDKGDQIKGIGNFATSAPIDGIGIRRRPYTTNIAVNEFTYHDIDDEEHNLGEVWAAMLWDLYWAMADKYGFDPTFSNKNAGNNRCIQLVMDGMKLQPCSPGFVDGRNAILKADTLLYNGENACLIWSVFARRGLGFGAKQGDSDFVGDETEDYEAFPTCINKTVIAKSAPFIIKSGQEITYSLSVRNLRAGEVNNVELEDHIPAGCTYVNGSSNLVPKSVASDKISWEISNMKSLETKTITYKLKTASDKYSNTRFFDDFEDPNTEFNYDFYQRKGNGIWLWAGGEGYQGSTAWISESSATEERDHSFNNITPIDMGDEITSLLFYHKINTQSGIDGGFVEISEDGGKIWNLLVTDDFQINPYVGGLDYDAIGIPFVKGFSGYTKDFIPSVASLEKYKGKKINVRFRYGNDDATESNNPGFKGWIVDNLEIINPFFYNSDFCIKTGLGEQYCVSLPGKGTLVDSKKVVGTNNPNEAGGTAAIYPNPAKEILNIKLEANHGVKQINLLNLNGQIISSKYVFGQEKQLLQFNTDHLPKGVIIVELIQENKVNSTKVILK